MFLTGLLLSAAVAQAEPRVDPVTFDLRCLIVAAQLRENPDPEIARNGEMAGLFFFGRVDARVPEAQLEARLMREVEALQRLNAQTMLRDCGEFMSARGQLLVEIGGRLEARGQ